MTTEQAFGGAPSRSDPERRARAIRVLSLAVTALGIALVAALGRDHVEAAQSADPGPEWKLSVTWEGRISTPEFDCQEDGLLLAPWGVYPHSNSVVVWCVAPEIYDDLGLRRWELWSPMKPLGAATYCANWHDAGLLHHEQDGRFWCEETEADQKRKQQQRRAGEA